MSILLEVLRTKENCSELRANQAPGCVSPVTAPKRTQGVQVDATPALH